MKAVLRHLKGLALATLMLCAMFVALGGLKSVGIDLTQSPRARVAAAEHERLERAGEGVERDLLEATNLITDVRLEDAYDGAYNVTVEYLAPVADLDPKQLYWIAEQAVKNRFTVRRFQVVGYPSPGPRPPGLQLTVRARVRQTAADVAEAKKAHEGHDHH